MIRTKYFKIGSLALLVGGLPSCATDSEMDAAANDNVDPVLGVILEGLGEEVGDCTSADEFDAANKTLAMDLEGGSSVFSVVNGAITVNGWPCYDNSTTPVALTTTNVSKLNVRTSGTGDKVVFDMLPGTFG